MRRPGGTRLGLVGAGLFAALAAVAIAAPLLAPFDPLDRAGQPFAPPGGRHLLGTNDVGQDLLSELLYGARISLAVGVAAALLATVVGTAVGVTAGYARGWVDAVLMRVVDVMLSLPVLPLIIVVGVFLGPGLGTQMAVVAGVLWARSARQVRSQALSTRELDHVLAARAMGARPRHVLARHLLPSMAPLVASQFVLATRAAIVLEASLSFLGLGDPTAKSWGTMLFFANARSAFLTDAWLWWVVPPGLGIAVAVLAFAFMGYALEERAHPVLAHGHARPRRRAGAGSGRRVIDATGGPDAVLEVRGLSVDYGPDGARALDDVHLRVGLGQVVGLVGESGSGKSTLVTAAMGLLRPPARITAGHVAVGGLDLSGLGREELRRLRGRRVALVPQQAMNALNPVFPVGDQLVEAIAVHRRIERAAGRRRAEELLTSVGVDPGRIDAFPHQLSGGMRQRVVIAMALANDPVLLIADEPTTGLDVLVQAEIIDLLGDLHTRLGLAMLVVSHDLAVVRALCAGHGRLAVMHAGRLVEEGPARAVVAQPMHPHTRALLDATVRPRFAGPVAGAPLLGAPS